MSVVNTVTSGQVIWHLSKLIDRIIGCLWSRRTTKIYAIIETGGKQHRITAGDNLDVALLQAEEGSNIELDRVLLAGDENNIVIGNPTLKGARVIATVNRHGKGKKIIVFRYKSKIRYSNKLGHRQHFTNLTIDRIEVPDLQPSTEKGSSEAGAEIKENQDGA